MPEGRSYTATRTSSVVEGAPFPKAKRRVLGQKKRRPVIVVRDADEPGELRELPGPADVRKADDRPDAEVRFFDYAGGTTVTRSLTNAADMSGADSERNAVLMSFNWSCDASSDGGANWKRLDPTTVFPNTLAGGFCCDQIVIYVPRADLFVWLLQYSADAAGQGAFRVAVSTSKSVQDDPTVWTYWDFVAGDFGWSTSDMDYPDLAYSDSFLYVSTDVIGSGRVVMRIALEELRAGEPSTTPTPTRTTGSSAGVRIWCSRPATPACGRATTTTAICSSSRGRTGRARTSWNTIPVAAWPNGTMSCPGPDGNDWLTKLRDFPGNAVTAAVQLGDGTVAWRGPRPTVRPTVGARTSSSRTSGTSR